MGQGWGRCRGGSALPRVQTENKLHRVRHSEGQVQGAGEGGRERGGTQRQKGTVIKIRRQRWRGQQGQRYRAERQKDQSLIDSEMEMERENSHRAVREMQPQSSESAERHRQGPRLRERVTGGQMV